MRHIGNFNVNFNNAFHVAQQFRNVQAILKIMLIEKMLFAFSDNTQVRLMTEPPLRSRGGCGHAQLCMVSSGGAGITHGRLSVRGIIIHLKCCCFDLLHKWRF